jgi:hypothetical protein
MLFEVVHFTKIIEILANKRFFKRTLRMLFLEKTWKILKFTKLLFISYWIWYECVKNAVKWNYQQTIDYKWIIKCIIFFSTKILSIIIRSCLFIYLQGYMLWPFFSSLYIENNSELNCKSIKIKKTNKMAMCLLNFF